MGGFGLDFVFEVCILAYYNAVCVFPCMTSLLEYGSCVV